MGMRLSELFEKLDGLCRKKYRGSLLGLGCLHFHGRRFIRGDAWTQRGTVRIVRCGDWVRPRNGGINVSRLTGCNCFWVMHFLLVLLLLLVLIVQLVLRSCLRQWGSLLFFKWPRHFNRKWKASSISGLGGKERVDAYPPIVVLPLSKDLEPQSPGCFQLQCCRPQTQTCYLQLRWKSDCDQRLLGDSLGRYHEVGFHQVFC